MDFKTICKQKDYIDISGDIVSLMDHSRWHSLTMPQGFGKTTLLSMLYYYFDLDENSYELFKDQVVCTQWNEWKDYLNQRVVIILDFNDFVAEDMRSALIYIRDMMLKLYQEKLHLIISDQNNYHTRYYMKTLLDLEKYDPGTDPNPNDAEKNTEENTRKQQNYRYYFKRRKISDGRTNLENSLKELLRYFYHGEYSTRNVVLLIDNMINLEICAEQYDYYQDMIEFLQEFLSFEPDKSCCLYLQMNDISKEEANEKSYFRNRYYCIDPSFLPHDTYMRWRSIHEMIINLNDKYHAKIRENRVIDQSQLDRDILNGTIYMLESENRAYQNAEQGHKKQIQQYRKPLNKDIPLYSENMGLKRMPFLERNEQYHTLNNLVKDIYEKTRDAKDFQDIYTLMQHVNEDKETNWNKQVFQEFKERYDGVRDGWKIDLHSSNRYWHQISVGDRQYKNLLAAVKVYVTTTGSNVKDLFIGASEELIRSGTGGYTAKVSLLERNDTICFYLNHHDFFLLEEYMKKHADKLKYGNSFIAHRGMLGISRDLIDYDSHNAQQARLLWDYFQIIHDKDEISIEEMYQMFILGWNADLAEDNPFRIDFERCSAQLFVLMMDSLDILLRRKTIEDDSLLLNDDSKIWNMLTDAKCWGDIQAQQQYIVPEHILFDFSNNFHFIRSICIVFFYEFEYNNKKGGMTYD